jgi:antitoxin YobK
MVDIDALIHQLDQSGEDVFWQGHASEASIERLESLLATRLPTSFRHFLRNYGGGGVAEEEVSGIENDDAALQHRGTIYGDTLQCRELYGLPNNLIVIYFVPDGDIVWCLDISRFHGDECPVVSFDVFSKSTKPIAPSFNDFLAEYLTLRISRPH